MIRAPDKLHGADRRAGQSKGRDHPCAVRGNHSRRTIDRLTPWRLFEVCVAKRSFASRLIKDRKS